MSDYNIEGTVRLYWDTEDKKRFGVQINKHNPPEFDPEENAYLQAMNEFNVLRNQIKVFTFDLYNQNHINMIENIITALGSIDSYAGMVTGTDEAPDFYLSDSKPDDEATFNWDNKVWELPSDYLNIVKKRKIVEIINARNNTIDTVGAEYNGLHYWSDKGSKSDVLFAVAGADKGQDLPAVWKAQDGILQNPTIEDIMGIALAIGKHVEAQYVKEYTLSLQVNNAITVEQVNAIEW